MKNEKITPALLVSTCDSYKPLWEGFFESFLTHFNYELEMFMTGTGTHFFRTKRVLGISRKYSNSDFSKRILVALRNIKSQYLLFMLDDFYLLSDVDTCIFNNAVDVIREDKNVGVIILHDEISHKCYMEDDYNEHFVTLKKSAPYRITTQAALWRKSFFKKVLRKGESPWQFEYLASYRSRRYKEKVLYRKDKLYSLFDYPHGGVFGDGQIRPEYLNLVSGDKKIIEFSYTYKRRQRPSLPVIRGLLNFQISIYPILSIYLKFVKKRFDYIPKKVCIENDTSTAIYLKK